MMKKLVILAGLLAVLPGCYLGASSASVGQMYPSEGQSITSLDAGVRFPLDALDNSFGFEATGRALLSSAKAADNLYGGRFAVLYQLLGPSYALGAGALYTDGDGFSVGAEAGLGGQLRLSVNAFLFGEGGVGVLNPTSPVDDERSWVSTPFIRMGLQVFYLE